MVARSRSRLSGRLLLLFGAYCLLWQGGFPGVPAFVAVFGGTGLTGREVVYQALQRGEEVRVLARDPAALLTPLGSAGPNGDQPLVDPKLTVVQGDVTRQSDVDKILTEGVSGVVVVLSGRLSGNPRTLLTDGTSNIVASMRRVGAKRIAVVTSMGLGVSKTQVPMYLEVLMETVLRDVFADKANQEALFMEASGPGADLEFTIVRPGGLTNGPPNGNIHVIDGIAKTIARADVADFCLGAILEPDFMYLRQSPCISSVDGKVWTRAAAALAA